MDKTDYDPPLDAFAKDPLDAFATPPPAATVADKVQQQPIDPVDLFASPPQAAAQQEDLVDLFAAPAPTMLSAIWAGLSKGPVRTLAGFAQLPAAYLAEPANPSITDAMVRKFQEGSPFSALGVGAQGIARELVQAGLSTSDQPDTAKAWANELARQGASVEAQAAQDVKLATPPNLPWWKEGIISAAVSVPQMVPWLVAARLGGAAVSPSFLSAGGIGQFAAMEAGQSFAEAKAAGASNEDAFKHMVISGSAEALGESLGFETLLKGGRDWFKKFLLQDIAGENFTTIAQQISNKQFVNEKTWTSPGEILHDLAVTTLGAALGAGTLKGVDTALTVFEKDKSARVREDNKAREDLARILSQLQVDATQNVEKPVLAPLTPEEEATAAIAETQLKSGLDVAPTPAGVAFGAGLDARLGTLPEDQDSGQVSEYVQEKRAQRANFFPSQGTPHSKRRIVAALDEKVLGLTLEQTGAPPPGSVVAIREEGQEDLYPTEVYQLIIEDMKNWMKRHAPRARIVLNLEQFGPDIRNNAFGLHQLNGFIDENGEHQNYHVITPREFISYEKRGVSDPKTTIGLFGGVVHEFGHVVRSEGFEGGLAEKFGRDAASRLNMAIEEGTLTADDLAVLETQAPEEFRLVREWQTLRESILNGTMSAEEYMEKWAGMRKLGESVARQYVTNKSLYEWMKNRLKLLGLAPEAASAAELLVGQRINKGKFLPTQIAALKQQLQFDEFMAEQYTRHAYTSGAVLRSRFGKFFADTMQRLRALFLNLKTRQNESGLQIIQPNEAFSNWLEMQTLRAKQQRKGASGTFKLSKEIRAKQRDIAIERLKVLAAQKEQVPATPEEAEQPKTKTVGELLRELVEKRDAQAAPAQEERKEKKAKAEKKKKEKAAPPKVPEEQAAVARDKKEIMQEKLDALFPEGLDAEDATDYRRYKALSEMIAANQLARFEEFYNKIVGERDLFDREYTSHVLAQLPDKEKIKTSILVDYAKQRNVKQVERDFWLNFAAEHPQGFTLEEAGVALQQRVTKLKPFKVRENKISQVMALEQEKFLKMSPRGQMMSDDVTVIWEAPISMPEMSTHYPDRPNYVSHSRYLDDGATRYIIEQQSDFYQKKAKNRAEITGIPPGYEKRSKANQERLKRIQEVRATVEMYRDFPGEVGENAPGQALRLDHKVALEIAVGKSKASGFTDQSIEGMLAELDKYEQAIQQQETQRSAQIQELTETSANAVADLNYWQRGWWKQQIKDNVQLAIEEGKTKLRFRTAETAALMENWPVWVRFDTLAGKTVDFTGQRFSEKTDTSLELTGSVRVIETRAGHVEYIVQALASDRQVKYAVTAANPIGELIGGWLQAGKGTVEYGPNQGIFDRYAKDIPEYLKKSFGAVPVTDGNQTWWEVNLEVSHQEAGMAWDRDVTNPLAPLNSSIRLTEQVGLTEEEIGRPEAVRGAQDAWKRLRFDSPYWKRFAGKTKAVGNDGLPVRVWAGVGSRIPVAGELPVMAFTTNPNNFAGAASREKGSAKQPRAQSFFLNLENPLEVDMQYSAYNAEDVQSLIQEAQVKGHDGVILRHVVDPLDSTVMITFSPEQAAQEAEIVRLDAVDQMHWDADSDQQQAVRGFLKGTQGFLTRAWMRADNARARTVDYLIQLQQVAGSQPEDMALQDFMQAKWAGERVKNQIQYFANETTKSMLNAFGSSHKAVKSLQILMQKEREGERLFGELRGLNRAGETVWQNGVGDRTNVITWQVHDSVALREAVQELGLAPESALGQRVIQHYLDVRNTFQIQFTGLANALWSNAMRKFAASPLLLRREYLRIEELHKGLREQPFVPQGHFGKYVLYIQQDQGPVPRGQRRYQTIYREHFEDVAKFNQAYTRVADHVNSQEGLQIKSTVLEDNVGIPLQLPRELLDTIAQTGEFEPDQIALLSELLVSSKHNKLAERYRKINSTIKGANQDFVRTFAAFTWHNSNYIWKLQFGPALRAAVQVAKSNVRLLENDDSLSGEEKLVLVQRQRRNIGLMDKAANYMLHPKDELQTLRYWFTMAYLAYGISTAAFNLSTQINYWAAISTEYGELKGSGHYLQSLKDTASIPWWQAIIDNPNTPAEERQRMQAIQWAYNQAVLDGLLDQSYAYYLAGQANSGGVLSTTATTAVGKLAHTVMETGMIPFRTVERGNRISTFLGFFNAELAQGTQPVLAYTLASQKVDALQGAYDPANRPELLRGQKAVFFMFASYTQFIQWTMAGGYERGARAQARAAGRKPPGAWHGTTVKLWIIYGLLGGLLDLPGAQNLLDIAKWAWRKFFGHEDLETELRQMFKDLGMDHNLMFHGVLHDIGGFDASGKFGVGRILPGTDLLNRDFMDPFSGFGQATLQSAGPAGGIVADAIRVLGKFSQGDIRGGFKQFPGVIGSVSKAYDAYLNQENAETHGVTLRSGERMTWDSQRGEFRDLTTKELVGQAFGLTPTIVSENRAAHYAMKGEETYWKVRRGDLMDKRYRARSNLDEEMLKEVDDMIARYNTEVPHPNLRITGKDKALSYREREREARRAESLGLPGPKGRVLAAPLRELYRNP